MSAKAPIAKRLKEARKRAELTQQQLGIYAGLDEDNASAKMNQYEQGVHIPKFQRLKDIASALKVPTAYFYAESDELAELLYHYEKLSKKERQNIIKKIK